MTRKLYTYPEYSPQFKCWGFGYVCYDRGLATAKGWATTRKGIEKHVRRIL